MFQDTIDRIRHEFTDGFWCMKIAFREWRKLMGMESRFDQWMQWRELSLYICGHPTLENYECF